MAAHPDTTTTLRITFGDGQTWEGTAVKQTLTHGAATADGQWIGEAGGVYHMLSVEDFTVDKLRGAKVQDVGAGDAATDLRCVSASALPTGCAWRLTCAAEGRAT